MNRNIGVDGSVETYRHNCDECKFICSLDSSGRVVDYYTCKGRLGRLELVWRYGNEEHHVSGMFAEPLSQITPEFLRRMDVKPRAFYLFAIRNNLGRLLNT